MIRIGERRQPDAAYLGILVCPKPGPVPFGSTAFYRRLAAAGRSLGLAVYVFALDWIDWPRRLVSGYAYDGAVWTRGEFPLPRLIYDRAFPRTKAQLMRLRAGLARLAAEPGVSLLGRGLGGKLDVYRLLANERELAELLPPTEAYAGPASLARHLRRRGDGGVVVKPQGGTHGKGVFRLRPLADGAYEARGRSGTNRTVVRRFDRLAALLRWTDEALIGGRPFLLQPYLELTTVEGAPFDIRALVQKNGKGRWTFTGAAARVGRPGGLTSNLHGGGASRPAETVLGERFGEERSKGILRRIEHAALTIPPVLERGHGPLLELGVDFGVDGRGHVWVLEVNSKPGRTSFARLADDRVRIAAVTSPIRYARYVLDRQLGGQNK